MRGNCLGGRTYTRVKTLYEPVANVVERSVDGDDYTTIGTTSAGMITFTDGQVNQHQAYEYRVRSFTKNSTSLITSSGDSVIRVWNLADGALIRSLHGHGSFPVFLSLTTGGNDPVSVSQDGIIVRDWATGLRLMSDRGRFFRQPLFVLSNGMIYKLTYPSQAIGQTEVKNVSTETIIERAPSAGISGPEQYVYSGFISTDGSTSAVCQNALTTTFNVDANIVACLVDIGDETLIARAGNDSTFVAGNSNAWDGPCISIHRLSYGWVPTN